MIAYAIPGLITFESNLGFLGVIGSVWTVFLAGVFQIAVPLKVGKVVQNLVLRTAFLWAASKSGESNERKEN